MKLRAFHAQLDPATLKVDEQYVSEFADRFCGTFKDSDTKEAAKQLLADRTRRIGDTASVHAEAALMALAWAAWSDGSIEGVESNVMSELRNCVFEFGTSLFVYDLSHTPFVDSCSPYWSEQEVLLLLLAARGLPTVSR